MNHTVKIPQECGDYLLLKELGRGSTACVYLARHKNTGSITALKLFHPFRESSALHRFKREFEIGSRLKHPHILALNASHFENHHTPFLLMDYVDGENLQTLQSRLPYVLPELAVNLMCQVLLALEAAHEESVIHRDLKPENILIRKDGHVFVSDFGLARFKENSFGTQSGTVIGSPDYMSPEQARGEHASAQSDLFSAAAILYFLVTGTPPFRRNSAMATLAAVLEKDPEPPSQRNPKLPAELNNLILKGLSKDPLKRFISAKEFRTSLEDYLIEVGLNASEWTLEHWAKDNAEFTFAALQTATEHLAKKCESHLREKKFTPFLQTLSHLNLKAPDSPTIERLLATYRLHKKKKRAAFWIPVTALGTVVLTLTGAFSYLNWSYTTEPTPQPPTTAVTAPVQMPAMITPSESSTAPAQTVQRKETVRKPTRNLTKPAERKNLSLGTVRFDVAENVTVLWNGTSIGGARTLRAIKPGRYAVGFQKPGQPLLKGEVEVKPREETLIRVQ